MRGFDRGEISTFFLCVFLYDQRSKELILLSKFGLLIIVRYIQCLYIFKINILIVLFNFNFIKNIFLIKFDPKIQALFKYYFLEKKVYFYANF